MVDLVICDMAENIGETCLRINTAESGCFNEYSPNVSVTPELYARPPSMLPAPVRRDIKSAELPMVAYEITKTEEVVVLVEMARSQSAGGQISMD